MEGERNVYKGRFLDDESFQANVKISCKTQPFYSEKWVAPTTKKMSHV